MRSVVDRIWPDSWRMGDDQQVLRLRRERTQQAMLAPFDARTRNRCLHSTGTEGGSPFFQASVARRRLWMV